jgi:hypothetical protein
MYTTWVVLLIISDASTDRYLLQKKNLRNINLVCLTIVKLKLNL